MGFHCSSVNISATTSKRKRFDLTLADKYEVIGLLDRRLSQSEIARRHGCSQSQVSRISKQREDIQQRYMTNPNPDRKRQRFGKSAEVELALSAWYDHAKSHDIPISGSILQEKARMFAFQLNQLDFEPSNGWLSRWKIRHGVSLKKAHGEIKDSERPTTDQ